MAIREKPSNSFPDDTQKNSKDCKSVIVISGKELELNQTQERKIKEMRKESEKKDEPKSI